MRHFAFFGLVSEGLLKQVDSEIWSERLKEASRQAERMVKELPEQKFERWGLADMISRTANTDLTAG